MPAVGSFLVFLLLVLAAAPSFQPYAPLIQASARVSEPRLIVWLLVALQPGSHRAPTRGELQMHITRAARAEVRAHDVFDCLENVPERLGRFS